MLHIYNVYAIVSYILSNKTTRMYKMNISWNHGYTEVEGILNKYEFTFANGQTYKIKDTNGNFGHIRFNDLDNELNLDSFYGLQFMATDSKNCDVTVLIKCPVEYANDDDDSHMKFLTDLDLDKDVYIVNGYDEFDMHGSSFRVKKIFVKE